MAQGYARHDGNCTRCGEAIHEGDPVKWSTNTKVSVIHQNCKPKDKDIPSPEVQDELERAFLRGEYYSDVSF